MVHGLIRLGPNTFKSRFGFTSRTGRILVGLWSHGFCSDEVETLSERAREFEWRYSDGSTGFTLSGVPRIHGERNRVIQLSWTMLHGPSTRWVLTDPLWVSPLVVDWIIFILSGGRGICDGSEARSSMTSKESIDDEEVPSCSRSCLSRRLWDRTERFPFQLNSDVNVLQSRLH